MENVNQRFLGEKETPHEHPLSAIGLSVISNAERIISSTYSTVDPFIISKVISSLRILTPSRSNTRASSSYLSPSCRHWSISASLITSKAYENPEQPPPSTRIFSTAKRSGSLYCKNLILIIALSATTKLNSGTISPSLFTGNTCDGFVFDSCTCCSETFWFSRLKSRRMFGVVT